jgi:hypothetical protein
MSMRDSHRHKLNRALMHWLNTDLVIIFILHSWRKEPTNRTERIKH